MHPSAKMNFSERTFREAGIVKILKASHPCLLTLRRLSVHMQWLPCLIEQEHVIIYSNKLVWGFSPSLLLPWLLTSDVLRRQSLTLYSVSVIFILESEQEADCKCLEPTYLLPHFHPSEGELHVWGPEANQDLPSCRDSVFKVLWFRSLY